MRDAPERGEPVRLLAITRFFDVQGSLEILESPLACRLEREMHREASKEIAPVDRNLNEVVGAGRERAQAQAALVRVGYHDDRHERECRNRADLADHFEPVRGVRVVVDDEAVDRHVPALHDCRSRRGEGVNDDAGDFCGDRSDQTQAQIAFVDDDDVLASFD